MSPEYRVEIVAPYVYRMQAENERAAAERAWELYGDGDEGVDPLAPAEVESVEELKPGGGSLGLPRAREVAEPFTHHSRNRLVNG